MFMNTQNKIKIVILILIIFLAASLRLYKLDQIPPSLNWDETAGAYNAYVIANWARDEWGQFLPLIFTSFRDDKHPVHVYITAVVVKIFGLSDFTARLSGALVGIFSVLVIYYLAGIFFKNSLAALFSAFFLAVSPYHLQFSRGLWEVNFALFFFLLGLLMFYLGIKKKARLINISFFSFGLSLLSYHSSKVVVPMMVLLLVVLYFKDLRKLSLNFYTGIFIFLIFITLLFIDPRLVGFARAKQTQFGQDVIEKTRIYQKTKNSTLGLAEIALNQYITHFSLNYLFLYGDQSPRNSVKTSGEFYKSDGLFFIAGLLYLIKLRSRVSLVLLFWLLLAPIPSSLVGGAPSATRAIFMAGSMHLLAGAGAAGIAGLLGKKLKVFVVILILLFVSVQAYFFLGYYFNAYPKKDPHEWQYGMKQIVEFVKEHEEYDYIFMTDIRSQPYIFFLYYLKHPLPEYLNSVVYNNSEESVKYNTVSYFGGYYLGKEGEERRINVYFGGWDPIESTPDKGRLYVVSPSQYDGLKHRSSFDVKKIIYYPDGGKAFYIVSAT
ncbi:hypothetical protein A2778_04010 [Candidatus Daviesbacteria bacterium RIFCSPHIGHO2_01_FULL_40_24]|uniref:Glycosyltransferase RgtA/B/C/D-like domain-containing protein n=1 Tax=Candidatus Daviesbacteria bacterium GW2011_GWC2_40_12 TaxID=1618431 RepID=A0A0G0QQD9_9BACT|nr:MAG: hypothetical protein UT04_C0032G0011 [Candidatus Daviesbacteria bacterium GW2011_GWF2_38_7]KKR42629.1 MAG: hypothetical protein UT77_C0001G0080 [Candidatus Daviesbacteria bacterium GW2011_GWC2_40_12]OGE21305.1 MAG: hypothetical protein A2778_04010 [Candidatus Daviesbacteria bacterium RIFCSPHIGHO2_01_FULL_40_24]OGE30177.1 MAG: hypothetical protein A3C29_02110 [Candidatus Daviesbacteria bacterium RIFCSPHIGHO2_02_FULL_40_16]OGE43388.1 MAG: hypothetical protein A3A53_02000 [Candidatus Davie